MSVSFGKNNFERLGCHPYALSKNKERSPVVWLLASKYAEFYQSEEVLGRVYEGWPSVFWHPKHRPPEPWFLAHPMLQWYPGALGDPRFREWNRHTAELDGVTLDRWLQYARRRLPVVERYGFYMGLLESFSMPRLMYAWERDRR